MLPTSTTEILTALNTRRKYPCIIADPPWDIHQKGRLGAINHYDLMSLEEIQGLPIAELAADNAHIWLWVTNGLVPQGMYAEEEARSVSENQKWRIQKMFEQGRPNTGRMLGYYLKDGQLVIIPEEAKIVCQIFTDYLSGMGRLAIAKKLNEMKVPTVRGTGEWREGSIYRILHNEKYTGDMLLQKTYATDFRTKKRVVNKGEKRRYYVENSHAPIISKELFREVQNEILRRRQQIKAPESTNLGILSGMITCAHCGKHFRRRIANASTKYAKPAWICATFATKGKDFCDNKQIPEHILIAKILEALNLTSLDGIDIRDYIAEIVCTRERELTFVLTSGKRITTVWQPTSRKASWTDEMKQRAREKTLERSSLHER